MDVVKLARIDNSVHARGYLPHGARISPYKLLVIDRRFQSLGLVVMKRALQITIFICLGFFALGLISACGSEESRLHEPNFNDEETAKLDTEIAVSVVQKDGGPRLAVELSFNMPRKRIVLRLPDSYLRKENLYQRIEDLTVSSPGTLTVHPESMSARILDYPVDERVVIKYIFRPDDPVTYLQGKESFSAPIIRDDYFQFVGSMVFIYPVALVGAPPFHLDLKWSLPDDFKIYNSYGAGQKSQAITTDFDRMRDSFFVAGRNIRSQEISVRNQPVTVTFEGNWNEIADTEFVDVVSRLLTTQRETFHDDNFPYFLVHFLAENIVHCNDQVKFAGTAHPNSFRAIFPTGSNCKLLPEMKQLISHELAHMWIGKKIRVGEERGHIDGKWFTEGFTDYFGRVTAYRAGVLDEADFFNGLNRQLEKYYISNERFVTLQGLVERMYRRGYSTRALEDIPYQQGEIMAWRLNKHIKSLTSFKNRLDDVILDMLVEAANAGGSKKFSVSEIGKHVDKYAPSAFNEEFSKIRTGGLFIPPKLDDCRMTEEGYVTKFQRTRKTVSEAIISYGTTIKSCDSWLR